MIASPYSLGHVPADWAAITGTQNRPPDVIDLWRRIDEVPIGASFRFSFNDGTISAIRLADGFKVMRGLHHLKSEPASAYDTEVALRIDAWKEDGRHGLPCGAMDRRFR